MKVLDTLSKLLRNITELIISIVLICMLTLVILQVLFRYILFMPLGWSEEMARYLMTWLVFLGASIASIKGEHLAITFLLDKLPSRYRTLVIILINVIICIFLAFAIKYGFDFIDKVKDTKSTALQISMAIPYLSVPVGCILIFIQTFINLLKDTMCLFGRNVST